MADALFLSRFTPSRTDPDVLERIFVQRMDLANDAEQRIVDGASGASKPQLLFIGPRGCGKTHLMALIFHRLNRRDELKDRLRIAWLAEDETTTSFVKLLLRISRALRSRYRDEFPEPDTQRMRQLDETGRAELLGRSLIEQLHGRTLLVIVENMDDVFKGLERQGQMQWRAFLQERSVIATLATSQQLFAGVSRREEPFFGFFHLEHLHPLTIEQAVQLLQKVAVEKNDQQLASFLETREGHSRISAIHHLSGGNHRIYIVLSDFITRQTLDELVAPFEKMLDEMTPYYQARLSFLSPQQREIVEYLAKSVYAAAVKDIAAGLMLPHTTVTSQLKSLKDLGYVRSDAVGREMRYELTEPLMRLCVEVKENNRGPVRLFVDFLRLWYSRGELTERLKTLPPNAAIEKECILQALDAMEPSEDARHPRLRRQHGEGQETIAASDTLFERFSQAQEEILRAQEAGTTPTSAQLAELQEAMAGYGTLIDRFAEGQALPVRERVASAMIHKGWTLAQLAKPQEEIAVYDALIERFSQAQELPLREAVAMAMYNKGVALGQLERVREEIAVYDALIERFSQAHELPLRESVAKAMYSKGVALWQTQEPQEEIAAYDALIERFSQAQELPLCELVADAMNNKGMTLSRMQRPQDAIAIYDTLIVRFGRAQRLPLRSQVASAMLNKSMALAQMKKAKEAIAVSDALIERFGQAQELSLRELVGKAILHKGATLWEMKRLREAIVVDDALIERLGQAQELRLRALVAMAMLSKGSTLQQMGRAHEAIAVYDALTERFGHVPELLMRPLVAYAIHNKGIQLAQLDRHEEALAALTESLKLTPESAMTLNGLACTLAQLGRHREALDAIEKAVAIDSKTAVVQYNHAEMLLATQRWEEGYAQLAKSLADHPLAEEADLADFPAIIKNILASARDREQWQDRLRQLVEICRDTGVLSHLGKGLVKSLRHIPSQMLNREVLLVWRDVWHEVADGLDEMRLPLRLLDVGIRYYETGKPEGLLDLVSQERSILAEALGLDLSTVVQAGKGE